MTGRRHVQGGALLGTLTLVVIALGLPASAEEMPRGRPSTYVVSEEANPILRTPSRVAATRTL